MKKNLFHGLKQSSRVWFEIFQKISKETRIQGHSDHTSFIKCNLSGIICIPIVYVNYIVLTEGDVTKIEKLKRNLPTKFEIKDFRSLKYYFLGKDATRSKNGISISHGPDEKLIKMGHTRLQYTER